MKKKTKHKDFNMVKIASDDGKTAYEIDREKGNRITQHGTPGHTGWRCGECARESANTVSIYTHNSTYWIERELEWQEVCDQLQNVFDQNVADHFPVHKPSGCTTCPKTPTMPDKPEAPFERALTQI